jgi:hypothetical protein
MNLKNTLLLDAASAAIFIILCLDFTAALAGLTGLDEGVITVAGWICVPSAALFVHQAFSPSRPLVTLVVLGNAAWVLASIGVWIAYLNQLTPLGHVTLIAQAIAVEVFTTLEWRGLKGLSARPAAA